MNPYEPSLAELEPTSRGPRPTHFWKFYSVAFSGYVLWFCFASWRFAVHPYVAGTNVVGIVSAVGLLGLAFSMRVGVRRLWSVWWWLFPATKLTLFYLLLEASRPVPGATAWVAPELFSWTLPLWLPAYYGIFRYSRSWIWHDDD